MRNRAFRRHQWDRARQRALRVLKRIWPTTPRPLDDRRIAEFAVDRTPCSCWMCGNPRRFTGEATLQERRAICRCDETDD
jgi:hypothetical protein